MIAKLTGVLDSQSADSAVVDVGGVGYLVFASRRTLGLLGGAGNPVALHIETHVREDHIHLYGFIDTAERDWFRLLTTVQGVGTKVALAVLGVLPPERLATAIAAQDRAALSRAEGVGAKLAARIAAELRDKVDAIALGAAARAAGGPAVPSGAGAPAAGGPGGAAAEDAISALVNLGYGRADAFTAVAKAAQRLGPEAGVSALIPAALKELAP